MPDWNNHHYPVQVDTVYTTVVCHFVCYYLFIHLYFIFIGRYDLHMPDLTCEVCNTSWTAGVHDLINSNYWPATLQFATVYATDVFLSFQELKMASPGLSCQAFLRMLDQRTAHYGRVRIYLILPTNVYGLSFLSCVEFVVY